MEKLLAEDAELQDGRLVVEEVKLKIKEASEEQTDDNSTAIESMVILCEGVHDQWVSSVAQPKSALSKALEAAGTCIACVKEGEGNRPTLAAAREACQAILAFVKQKGVCGDLGKPG